MPFLRSSSRPRPVDCFFCLSPSLLPPQQPSSPIDRKGKGKSHVAEVGTRWNWRCEGCGCWNVRDERGEMISDHPAMHSTSMNQRSFPLRGKPSSSHLPPTTSTSPFCHSCLGNQTLITNMLANYLPDDSDPAFPELYADLPDYLAKLHSRYPPVCPACRPAVEEALRKSDQRAQGEAWGSALRRGAMGSERGRDPGKRVGWVDVVIWRLRGGLFCLGIGLSWGQGLLASFFSTRLEQVLDASSRYQMSLFVFHLASILWIAWDPYWLRRVRSRHRAKVFGRGTWIRDMLCIMLIRIAVSAHSLWGHDKIGVLLRLVYMMRVALAVELALSAHALITLRFTQPVAIQLVRPFTHTTSPQPRSSVDNLPYLLNGQGPGSTASTKQASSLRVNPMFGRPSLRSPSPADQSEAMDWEPSPGAAVSNGGWTRRPPSTWDADDLEPDLPTTSDWDSFAVNKQRIFAEPHTEDTGLESLLAGWGLDGVATSDGTSSMVAPSAMRQRQGMIVDERFLRAVSWCLFAARCIGAIALTIGHIETKIIGDVLSANRTMLFAELGATSVQLVLLWTIPNNRSPQSSFVRNGIQIISILARCTALIRPVAVDNFVQAIRWSDRRIPVEWAAWAVLDLVSCCI